MIYGWQLTSYRTVCRALLTIISLQIGIFNYDEVLIFLYFLFPVEFLWCSYWSFDASQVLNGHPLLGGFMFGSCIVFMSFMVLNFLISVILVAFSNEQIYHKVNIYILFNWGDWQCCWTGHPSYPDKLLVCFHPLYYKLQGVFNLTAPAWKVVSCEWMWGGELMQTSKVYFWFDGGSRGITYWT